MTYTQFNAFCRSLQATTWVKQWGGSHVWKVGGKVFAVGGWGDDQPAFTFRVEPSTFALINHQPGLRPAPYFASRGMSWIQHYAKPGLPNRVLKEALRDSHALVVAGLSLKLRRTLGFPG